LQQFFKFIVIFENTRYSDVGALQCISCEAGLVSNDNRTACVSCSEGTYSTDGMQKKKKQKTQVK
jgi:hypothetical protein